MSVRLTDEGFFQMVNELLKTERILIEKKRRELKEKIYEKCHLIVQVIYHLPTKINN
jgi:hypothetical protein